MKVAPIIEFGTFVSRNRGCFLKGKPASLVAQPKIFLKMMLS